MLPLSQKDRSVQLTPQRMRVEASPNTPIRLNFSVALANVPVDIYFVMDHSNSMDEHKRNLVNAAHKIAKQVGDTLHLVPIWYSSMQLHLELNSS